MIIDVVDMYDPIARASAPLQPLPPGYTAVTGGIAASARTGSMPVRPDGSSGGVELMVSAIIRAATEGGRSRPVSVLRIW